MRDQNRRGGQNVTRRDVERLESQFAQKLHEVVVDRFAASGWRVVDDPAAAALVARPRISELNLFAPDIPGPQRTRVYADSIGSMTLHLALFEGVEGPLVFDTTDLRRDPRREWFEWRTRPGNTARAGLLMNAWADDVLAVLINPGSIPPSR